mmetsp:Transcript_2580/g.3669  ORF Transcript_2580/g.3669 Transcript_2580/m.3669 type:complete len:292 (-) Transcript_2580:459-1334(-)
MVCDICCKGRKLLPNGSSQKLHTPFSDSRCPFNQMPPDKQLSFSSQGKGDSMLCSCGTKEGATLLTSGQKTAIDCCRRPKQKENEHLLSLHLKILQLKNERIKLNEFVGKCNTAMSVLKSSSRDLDLKKEIDKRNYHDCSPVLTPAPTQKFDVLNVREAITAKCGEMIAEKPFPMQNISTMPSNDIPRIYYEQLSLQNSANPVPGTSFSWGKGIVKSPQAERVTLNLDYLNFEHKRRNKIHSKLTRNRKEFFIRQITRTISQLESENKLIKLALRIALGKRKLKSRGKSGL